MQFIEVKVPGAKAYALPIGDIHFGDKAFRKEGLPKLKGNLDWLAERKDHAFGVFTGDIFNIAGRGEKTSPFESDPGEIEEATDFFAPYADLFAAAVDGNHEARVENAYGFNPLKLFCKTLGIPYLGHMGLVRVQVGKRPEHDWYWQNYYLAVHHTTGGGKLLGSALNGVEQLSKIVPGCDVYCGGHNHQLVTGKRDVLIPSPTGPKSLTTHYVSCGSYLDYQDSYAEKGLFAPSHLGSPRIRFNGERDRHDVHVSI